MRKLLIFVLVILLLGSAITSFGDNDEYENKKVYYVDSQIFSLIGVNTEISKGNKEAQAKELIDQLIKGHDENNKIKRVIPNNQNALSVKVRDNTAYVNINKKYFTQSGRETERLIVYSIVNTLTSVDGIDVVRFTIDKSTSKDFMGYLDMREGFVTNYLY